MAEKQQKNETEEHVNNKSYGGIAVGQYSPPLAQQILAHKTVKPHSKHTHNKRHCHRVCQQDDIDLNIILKQRGTRCVRERTNCA